MVPAALLAAVNDTVSNVVTTATVVSGGAPLMVAPPPAGSDEASALATVNTTAHSANFLAVAAMNFLEMARYAGNIGMCEAATDMVDSANGMQFV
ncbi:MAG: hypothetical protein QG597_1206 [Actinomycetota bacterium]|nr:hypothetical protein [Actinomycetota bacterium]